MLIRNVWEKEEEREGGIEREKERLICDYLDLGNVFIKNNFSVLVFDVKRR